MNEAHRELTGWELAQQITNCFDDDTGLVDVDALDALQIAFDRKIEAMGHVVRNLHSMAEGAKAEAAYQKERGERFIRQAGSVIDRAQWLMESVGKAKVITSTTNAVIGKGSLRTVVDDLGKLPPIYVRTEERVTADKKLIGQAIDGGAAIPGAHRERGPSRLKFK